MSQAKQETSADQASHFDGMVEAVLLDSRSGERFKALGGLDAKATAYTNSREYDAFTWFVLGWASALDANRLKERFADSPPTP